MQRHFYNTHYKKRFVVKDIHTGMKHLYPTKTKGSADTEPALQHFIGSRSANMCYSDNSGEINVACRPLRILPFNSQPGIPPKNAVICD